MGQACDKLLGLACKKSEIVGVDSKKKEELTKICLGDLW
jgi:hypothetical protein